MSKDRGLFERVSKSIDRAWVLQALAQSGIATVRRRRLPADMVIWLVIGMALFRDRCIDEVVRALDLVLPSEKGKGVSHSAVVQARGRVGAKPLEWLFQTTGRKWADESAARHPWRGLKLFCIDGTTHRVHDTPDNREHFGKHSCQNGDSGYPIVRAVSLMAARAHLLADMRIGPHSTGEQTLARELWAQVPDDSLTIVDRGFFAAAPLITLAAQGRNRHWLRRARAGQRFEKIQRLGDGDELVQVTLDPHTRAADDSLPKTWTMRAINYQRPGFRPSTLLTSLLDPAAFPASEIIQLYHERWEIELGYGEIKRVMLDREETLRSKNPDTVAQEIWGLAIAYNLIRLEVERTAAQLGVAPTRISFKAAYVLVRDTFLSIGFASPGVIPKRLRALREDIAHFTLPPRRHERSYPRAVKVALSPYPSRTQAARRAAAQK